MLDTLLCAFSLEHEFYSDIKNINLFSIIDQLSLLAQHYPLNRECDSKDPGNFKFKYMLKPRIFCKCDEILQKNNVLLLY